jgi:DNA repair protein RadC
MPYQKLRITVKLIGRSKLPPPTLDNPVAAVETVRKICSLNTILWREEVLMLCVNTANRLNGWDRLAIGGIDAIIIDRRIIGTIAYHWAATGIIIAHNHPGGGKLSPSPEDKLVTYQVRDALEIIGVDLVDHIIFNNETHLSMKDAGYL